MKKKEIIQLSFIVVCLFIHDKALAVWNKDCCHVCYIPHPANKKYEQNTINIHFKFFEYEIQYGIDNAYIKNFEALYTTNRGLSYKHLMSASTENQTSRTWAWIDLKNKRIDSKIELLLVPYNSTKPVTVLWRNGSNPRFEVKNTYMFCKNETWLWVDWFIPDDLDNITHIQIKAIWHMPGMELNDFVELIYDINPKKGKLSSNRLNSSNSSLNQKIRIDAKKNTLKAYKKANSIIVKGALRENIKVYATTGKLLKSNCGR